MGADAGGGGRTITGDPPAERPRKPVETTGATAMMVIRQFLKSILVLAVAGWVLWTVAPGRPLFARRPAD